MTGKVGQLLSWLAITYNCQCLTDPTRLQSLQRELHPDIMGLQGTRLAPRRDPVTGKKEVHWNQIRGKYQTWNWSRAAATAVTDPSGVSISLRLRRCLRGMKAESQTPRDERLQGRVGCVRWKKPGIIDMACAVVYLPGGQRAADRAVYAACLGWVRETFAALPKRCTELVLIDANTHVGAVPVQNAFGDFLIGVTRAAPESHMAGQLRAFL